MARETVSFTNAEGVTLSGILERPDGPVEAWALFAHCFTCSKNTLAASRIADGLAARGFGVLRFDFTGLGQSEGTFSDTGFSSNVEDLKAAVAWMDGQGYPVQLMIGHSLGGAATVVAAAELPDIRAVVTLGAPADADHVIHQFEQHVPEIEAKGEAQVDLGGRPFVLSKVFLDSVRDAKVRDAAAALRRPLLVMHSPRDETVSIDNATGLFLAAKHPKSFVSLDPAGHMLGNRKDTDYVCDVVAGWSRRYLDAPAAAETQGKEGYVRVEETGVVSPYQNNVHIDGRTLIVDEPKSIGGADTGPNPYQLVTAGLGTCTSITLRMYANHKKWPLDRVTVDLRYSREHHKDCENCGPSDRIDVFTREISLQGDLTEEQRQRLLEIADRCPVHRTLENQAVVETVLVTQSA